MTLPFRISNSLIYDATDYQVAACPNTAIAKQICDALNSITAMTTELTALHAEIIELCAGYVKVAQSLADLGVRLTRGQST